MNILAVDTALGACSVAVLADDEVRAHRFEIMQRGHAEALAPMVEAAMAEAGLAFDALDRLAVTTGPGTFTGQRVGLAFMRGLRLALKRPLSGVTTLQAMASAALAETGFSHAAALHDARRDEVYLETSGPGPFAAAPQILGFEDAVAVLRASLPAGVSLALAGTAAPAAAPALAAAGVLVTVTAVAQPDALQVARLAQALPASDAAPKPLYLRPPDAKLPATAAVR